ncbi:hypothetical protein [Legionella sp. WA2022007384]
MTVKGEENSQLKSEDLVFLLAIAGRIDAQSRLLAQKLDKDRYIYHAYAIMDSLSSSYSMFKYFFEVFFSKTDPDLIHKVLTSPEGIAAVAAEAIFLVSFSFLASVYDKEKKDSVKKFIASAWPYFRDLMKGLKNAYKGWRSTVQVLSLISGMDLKYMVIPVGLVLGIFAAANRLWIRSMVEQRKIQMDKNKELLLQIQQLSSITPLDRNSYLSRIEYQDNDTRAYAYLAVATGGLLDGLYLYIGVVSLSVLSPPLLLALSIIGVFYTLSCVISRIYEEYDFQLRLEVTQTRCKLALTTKELELTYAKLLELQAHKSTQNNDLEEIRALKREICRLIDNFEEERQLLQDQLTYSYATAGLLGMKYGLFAYGVLTSIIFTAASLSLITAGSFPPALLAVIIVSGLVLMIGLAAYTLNAHYQHMQRREEASKKERPYTQIMDMRKRIETNIDADVLDAEPFATSLKDGLKLDPSPQTFFQEWFEVFRSFASGLSKGNNFFNFAMTFAQEADSDGHYHDIPIMGEFAIVSGVLFSLVLGLRALAKGLGRLQDQASSTKTKGTDCAGVSMEEIKTRSLRESSERPKRKASDSQPKNGSSFLNFFYHKKTSPAATLPHSRSDTNLSQHHPSSSPGSIFGGLE